MNSGVIMKLLFERFVQRLTFSNILATSDEPGVQV